MQRVDACLALWYVYAHGGTMKSRQKLILKALQLLGGTATTREIADAANLNTNGVSQSLGALSPEYVKFLNGTGAESTWMLVKNI